MAPGQSDHLEVYFTPNLEEFYEVFYFCTDCLVFPTCHDVLRIYDDTKKLSHNRVTVRPCRMFSNTFTKYKEIYNEMQGWHVIRQESEGSNG